MQHHRRSFLVIWFENVCKALPLSFQSRIAFLSVIGRLIGSKKRRKAEDTLCAEGFPYNNTKYIVSKISTRLKYFKMEDGFTVGLARARNRRESPMNV